MVYKLPNPFRHIPLSPTPTVYWQGTTTTIRQRRDYVYNNIMYIPRVQQYWPLPQRIAWYIHIIIYPSTNYVI